MKTVLMILPEFGYGGAEKSFCALSVELANYYNVTIVVFNLKRNPIYPLGGEVISLEAFSSKSWIGKLYQFYIRVVRLKQIKKQIKPDASISFLEGADFINILSSLGESTILSIRGSKRHDQNIKGLIGHFRKSLLIPLFYARANHIVTLSKGLEEEILSTYTHLSERLVRTIYNVIDTDKVTHMANEPLLEDWVSYYTKHKVLVLASRLEIEKGIHLFLPVFAELCNHLDDIRLLIIGDGEFHEILKRKCHELKLSTNVFSLENVLIDAKVHFLGYQMNPFKWIRKANIFVSSSLHEGFGNSILEAIICNVPVIASDCPYGPREIIDDSTTKRKIQYPYHRNNCILLPIINSRTMGLWVNTILDQLTKNYKAKNEEDTYLLDLERFNKVTFRDKWIEVIETN